MPRISKEEYVRNIAQSLNLPPALIEKITVQRPEGDERDGGWKIARTITVADLEPYGLADRLAAPGARTVFRSIVED
jgi:hypothetical protein